jgi:hypothetical protein
MVTTVSVSTVTTITTMAAMGLTAVFSMGAGILLLMLLTTKQLAVASGRGFASCLGRFTTIGIVPLLIGFGIIMVFKLLQIMQ